MNKNGVYKLYLYGVLLLVLGMLTQCIKNSNNPTVSYPLTDINNTLGFGLMNKLVGIWKGPVTSTTALGGFQEWIVDFRPISENQIAAKNELDTANDIFMSFFISKYNSEYRLCFRNGGSFKGQTRVSYFLCDSVFESSSSSYYRFSEIIKGKTRAYTELIFNGDNLTLKSFTNKYNTLTEPTLHMSWNAILQDNTACLGALSYFNFPKKTLTKDFTSSFKGLSESIFYSTIPGDPYTESQQPYLGIAKINYTYAGTYVPDANKKTFLIVTTQPLINGFNIQMQNFLYRTRYVILAANRPYFEFNYMHPGTYYLYALYDKDGNGTFSSNDWVSNNNTSFTLTEKATINATTEINFTIP